MARWNRATQWLQLEPGSRVLDLGCAFGFGTSKLVDRYETFGHDLSEGYIARARKSVPRATFTHGPADRVPYPDGFFDGVLLLDVLEHVPDERAVIHEVVRLLRPGGVLVLSVPNRGILGRYDSLNLYRRLLGSRAPAPTDDPSWSRSPVHRHYALQALEQLLAPAFSVAAPQFTGIGIAEFINLPLLLLLRRRPQLHRIYDAAQYLYFGVYLVEDLIEVGPWGYHMMIRAVRL